MQLNRRIVITISSGTTSYNSIDDFGITSGSMKLDEMLCDGEFSLNQLCASKFEAQCFNLDEDVNGWDINVVCQNLEYTTNGEPIVASSYYLFTGIIDSSSTDYFNDFRDIVAYDKLYTLRDENVGEWWDTFWASRPEHTVVAVPTGSPILNNYYEYINNEYVPTEDTSVQQGKTYYYAIPIATVYDLRTALCTEVNLAYETISLVNDSVQAKKYTSSITDSATQITFGEIMSAVCEINGTIGHIDRDGTFKFLTLDDTAKTLGQYEKVNATFEDYQTELITGINVYESDNNLMLSYADNTNAYNIVGNIFTLTLDSYDVLETICYNILQKINMIQYIPCNIPIVVSDLTMKVGDMVESDTGIHYIFAQSFSNSLLVDQTIDCPAYGEVLSKNVSDLNNRVVANQKYSAIYQDQDEIRTEVSNVQTNVSSLTTTVSQTASEITATVTTLSSTVGALATAVKIDERGVTITQDTPGSYTGSYTLFTADGMEIYVEDTKVAWAESGGFSARELMIGEPSGQRWHIQETNDGNSLIFSRR